MSVDQLAPPLRAAFRVHVTGVVQGVGFRPFVHRLATHHGVAGWVRNESGEVRILIEGDPPRLRGFLSDLATEAPPNAAIAALDIETAEPEGHLAFAIVPSEMKDRRRQPIMPDVAICAACERELFDPANRRFHYPFITCTDCGPRFTVIETLPYDRERTSMRAFVQCDECRAEYQTPTDRRYHSQTNSCPSCGPKAVFVPAGERASSGFVEQAVTMAADFLRQGLIVAVKGLGGFHLAADATNDAAVRRLRERKHRDAKPLAVMVRSLADARDLGVVGPEEERLLVSRERPIVLLKAAPTTPVVATVAPGLDTIGVMIAYTPLHHLLLESACRPLVMTSGNSSDEPIAIDNGDAFMRLSGIADAFLVHDRAIVARYDDSVVRVAAGAPVFLRRARGHAPLPLDLPIPAPAPLVAVGAHLKNTFALAYGSSAFVSQHVGDLENLETLEHFEATLTTYRRQFHIDPLVAVRDRHPGYLSSRVAEELGASRILDVQHHHAHLAAVAAEYGITHAVIGVTFDGTGLGDDGAIWGGEVLLGDLTAYRRVGRLRYAPLPGGDLAARRPWRTALGYLSRAPGMERAFARALAPVAPAELDVARSQIERSLNAPLASSMGRLFDAAAAVLGIRHVAQYEAQAAMELEAVAGARPATPLPFPILPDGDGWLLDPIPLLVALGELAALGEDRADLAARFHESVAHSTAVLVGRVAEASNVRTVVLGGGVFQNARLASSVTRELATLNLDAKLPRLLSPNDGAISYGQAAVAAAQLQSER